MILVSILIKKIIRNTTQSQLPHLQDSIYRDMVWI